MGETGQGGNSGAHASPTDGSRNRGRAAAPTVTGCTAMSDIRFDSHLRTGHLASGANLQRRSVGAWLDYPSPKSFIISRLWLLERRRASGNETDI